VLAAALFALLMPRISGANDNARYVKFSGHVWDLPTKLARVLRLDSPSAAVRNDVIRRLARCSEGISPTAGMSIPKNATPGQHARRLLDALGYCVATVKPGKKVEIQLYRYQLIRRVTVSGNWPIFQEEVLRRLRFRTGQRLSDEVKVRDQAVARERERIERFLSSRGYPEGTAKMTFSKPDSGNRVNLHVRLYKGDEYRIGEIRVVPLGRRQRLGQTASPAAVTDRETTNPRKKEDRARRKQRRAGRKKREQSFKPAIPRRDIESMFRTRRFIFFEAPFSTRRFKENVEALTKRYQKAGFPGVRIQGRYKKHKATKKVLVTLAIQERKRIVVKYEGNNNVDKSDIDEVLTLAEASAYDDYELAQSAKKIVQLCRSKGYLQARVRFSRKPIAGKKPADTITFHINEGPRFRVKKVRFVGHKELSTSTLKAVVRTKPYPFLGLGSGGYATPKQVAQDAERIKALYRTKGFPLTRVRAQMAPHPVLLGNPAALAVAIGSQQAQNGKLYVRFTIEEGPRAKVGEVTLAGAKAIDAKKILASLALKRGRPFTAAELAKDKKRIVRLYAERGYPYATSTSLESFDDDTSGGVVDIQFTVKEGKRVRFGDIFVRGNHATRHFVIKHAIGFRKGDIFDIRKIDIAERTLRDLGIFNAVRIQLLQARTRAEQIPVLVRVEERYDDTGSLQLGAGFSTDNLFFGSFGYTWFNFFGMGARFEIKAELGPQIQSSNLNIYYPRFWGTKFSADLRLFLRNEVTERLGDIFTYGTTLTFSRQLLRGLRGYLRYEIRQVEIEEPLNRPPGPVDESNTRPTQTRTAALSSALTYDGRDNPLLPTRGIRLIGTVRFASEYLGGTDTFLTLQLYGQAFIPLFFDIVIAVGVRYDHGIPMRGAVVLPKVERFFAGGDTTIRGFEEDRAFAERIEGPLSPLGGTSYVKLVPQGGNIRLLTNIELQFPIWKNSPLGLPLMGAIFLDNGVVLNSFERFEWQDFRHGLGGAIRIATAVGSLSLEYAFPLDPGLRDPKDGRFHFNFGVLF
jgi:outer membrane protein insertion porin family